MCVYLPTRANCVKVYTDKMRLVKVCSDITRPDKKSDHFSHIFSILRVIVGIKFWFETVRGVRSLDSRVPLGQNCRPAEIPFSRTRVWCLLKNYSGPKLQEALLPRPTCKIWGWGKRFQRNVMPRGGRFQLRRYHIKKSLRRMLVKSWRMPLP